MKKKLLQIYQKRYILTSFGKSRPRFQSLKVIKNVVANNACNDQRGAPATRERKLPLIFPERVNRPSHTRVSDHDEIL